MWKIVLPLLAAVFAVGSGAWMSWAFENIDPNDEGAREALNIGIAQHNRVSTSVYLSQVAKVLSVQRQEGNVTTYRINVRLAKTPCRKDDGNEACCVMCEVHKDPEKGQPYECVFTVWSSPSKNDMNFEKEHCFD